MQISTYVIKNWLYPAMTPFWNIVQCYCDQMSLTARLWADLVQCPKLIFQLRCFSVPGTNLGCLLGPGITWCLRTGMNHDPFLKVYNIRLQQWKDVWICPLISGFSVIEQPLCNRVCFVWWLRLSWMGVWGGENREISLAHAVQLATLAAVWHVRSCVFCRWLRWHKPLMPSGASRESGNNGPSLLFTHCILSHKSRGGSITYIPSPYYFSE